MNNLPWLEDCKKCEIRDYCGSIMVEFPPCANLKRVEELSKYVKELSEPLESHQTGYIIISSVVERLNKIIGAKQPKEE